MLVPVFFKYFYSPIISVFKLKTTSTQLRTNDHKNNESLIILKSLYPKMKRQLFFLFYSEDDSNDVNAKLVKTYANRFIIDEDAECEVIEVNKIPDVKYSEFGVILKLKLIYTILFHFKSTYSSIYQIFEQAAERSILIQDEEFRTHFLIGMSNHFEITLICLFCTPASLHCTLLRGDRTDLKRAILHCGNDHYSRNTIITIGDDIESVIERFNKDKQMTIWQRVWFEMKNKYISSGYWNSRTISHWYKLLNLSESVKIQCERQSLYSGSKRHFSTPSIFTPMLIFSLANFIVAPTLFGLFMNLLIMLMKGIPTIDSTVPCKILDFFVMTIFLTKLLLFAKKYFQVLLLFYIFVLYFQSFPVLFIRNIFEPEICIRLLFCVVIIKLFDILSARYFF